jgi:hypothetical protein
VGGWVGVCLVVWRGSACGVVRACVPVGSLVCVAVAVWVDEGGAANL